MRMLIIRGVSYQCTPSRCSSFELCCFVDLNACSTFAIYEEMRSCGAERVRVLFDRLDESILMDIVVEHLKRHQRSWGF